MLKSFVCHKNIQNWKDNFYDKYFYSKSHRKITQNQWITSLEKVEIFCIINVGFSEKKFNCSQYKALKWGKSYSKFINRFQLHVANIFKFWLMQNIFSNKCNKLKRQIFLFFYISWGTYKLHCNYKNCLIDFFYFIPI